MIFKRLPLGSYMAKVRSKASVLTDQLYLVFLETCREGYIKNVEKIKWRENVFD